MKGLQQSAIVAVIGAGTMGAGVAQVAAAAGHPVLLYDAQQGAALKGLERTASGLEKLVSRGRMTEQERQALLERIQVVESLSQLAPAQLVIEAIIEDLKIKQDLFAELEQLCSEDCIFATNTSSISVTAIAAVLERPQNFLGMHFFNPAPIMKLVEVVSGLATRKEIAEMVHATASNWGKKAVYAKSTPGFIVNRVARPFYAEALRIMQEQAADAVTLDTIMRDSGGFRMGPFELMDLIGHDVNFAVTQSVFNAYFNDPRFLPSLIQQELVLAGRLGRKSGQGFYDYSDNASAVQAEFLQSDIKPASLTVYGDLSIAQPLITAWQDGGITVVQRAPDKPQLDGVIKVDECHLALSDGRSASIRSAQDDISNLVLFDLALDYESSKTLAISIARQTHKAAAQKAVGALMAAGKQLCLIGDVPGMLVMRSVAMLANEAADAVNQGVCSVQDVDAAMQLGVNYPKGPLAWADELGVDKIQTVLNSLADIYGEDRYRCSPLISQLVAAEQKFHA